MCVVCPSNDFSNSSGSLTYNSTYGHCIPTCNNGYTFNGNVCAPNCDPSYLYNDFSNLCCASTEYFDGSKCTVCPSNNYSNSSGTLTYNSTYEYCIPTCNNGYTFDSSNNQCSFDCSASYLLDPSTNSCCTTDFYDPTTKSCIDCSSLTNTFSNSTGNLIFSSLNPPNYCIPTCDASYTFNGTECVPNCTSSNLYNDFSNTCCDFSFNGAECVPSCNPSYLYNNISNTCCDSSDGLGYFNTVYNSCQVCNMDGDYIASANISELSGCVITCESGYVPNSANQCQPDCSSSLLNNSNPNNLYCCPSDDGAGYYNSVLQECLSCESGYIFSESLPGCNYPVCPSGNSIWDTNTNQCVLECSSYLFNNISNTCCDSSAGMGYSITYNGGDTSGCGICPTNQIYYPYYSSCGPICASGLTYLGSQGCINMTCPSGQMYYSEASGYNGECGPICTGGETYNFNQCSY